jgi:predicted MFS family arabinose efflux permease
VTGGRLVSAFLSLFVSPKKIFLALPLLLLLAFLGVGTFAKDESTSLWLFAFAGLACSAFFPLGVSLSTSSFSTHKERVSGMMVGLYLVGYGVTAEGFGFFHQVLAYSYSSLFVAMSVTACCMFFLNVYINVRLGKKVS